MAEVDFNNPNLDGDFKELLKVRQAKKVDKSESQLFTPVIVPETTDEVCAIKEKSKVDQLRELLFQAAKTDNVTLLENVAKELPQFNLGLSDQSLRDPETRATALHVALEQKAAEVARYLLGHVADDDYLCCAQDVLVRSTMTKKTALHILADVGDASLTAELLSRVDDPKKRRNLLYETSLMAVAGQRPRDFTAIHIAALRGNTGVLDYLVKQGVDVNLTNKKEDTPALWAARGNSLETMRRLIELRADVDHRNDKGSTPLYWAVRYGFADMVRLLAKEGNANVNQKRKLGLVSPIVMASALGYAEIASLLLSFGAEVNTKITNDQTALHYSAASGLDDVVEVLLKYKATVDASDDMGRTPLHMAAKNGHLSTMRILCASGASIECRDKFGKTAWNYAVEADGLGVLDVIVNVYRKRAGVVGRTLSLPVDEAPLHEAARVGDLEKIRYLISQGCDPLAVDAAGNTFFHVAARENQPEILKAFQNNDAMNKPNNEGDIPVHLAARCGHEEVIAVLIKKSKLNAKNKLGYTALHDACSAKQALACSAVAVLVKAMVDDNNWSLIDARDNRGNTALHLAAMCNHFEVIPDLKLLNPSLLNADGDNPFHAAAKRGNSAVLEAMFEIFNTPGKGLDLEQKNGEGETVLHICSKAGSVELVNDLIEAGADLAHQNKQGNTILHEMAEEMSINPSCAESLLVVYNEVVKCSPKWWCIKHDLAHPDENSDTYADYKRQSLVYLTSAVYNFESYNVLAYCAKVGALPLFRAIMATEGVSLLSKGKYYVYDVTNITPSTCVEAPRRRRSGVFSSRAVVDPNCDDDHDHDDPQANLSYLDVIVGMPDEVLATKFLDVSPVKQLSDNLWGGYQWIYIMIMIVHIAYMSSLSATAISAAGVPFNTSTAVQYTDPPTYFPYVLFISWPIVISMYQIVAFVIQLRDYARRMRTARHVRQHGDFRASKTECCRPLKLALASMQGTLLSLSGVTTLTFSSFVFAWFFYYVSGHRNQVYFLAVAMILGWMLTIAFTKGFRSVHAFSTMLFYIIIKDVTRFMTIYLFMLIGFSLAMHTLFQISAAVVGVYTSPWHTIFLTFNLMLGMADLFDSDFDSSFESAGSSSIWVKLVYLFYMILATIIMLNLLIAMLSDTYNEIKSREGSTWRVNSLRMALRIERWMPLLKRVATRISLLNMMAEFDDETKRWFMRIAVDRTAESDNQSVGVISEDLKRLEIEVSSMHGSYRGLQEKLDAILDHLEPTRPKSRAKTATKRPTNYEKRRTISKQSIH